MNNTNNSAATLFVVTVVDHPELRDSSFKPVRTGSTINTRIACKTQGAATRLMASLLAGEDDFASEFTCRVRVEAENLGTGRIRTVRSAHHRLSRTAEWEKGY